MYHAHKLINSIDHKVWVSSDLNGQILFSIKADQDFVTIKYLKGFQSHRHESRVNVRVVTNADVRTDGCMNALKNRSLYPTMPKAGATKRKMRPPQQQPRAYCMPVELQLISDVYDEICLNTDLVS